MTSLGCAAELDVASGSKKGPLASDGGSDGNGDAPDGRNASWSACDNTGTMFDEARTGDGCSFANPCGKTDGCMSRTASCSSGVLRMTQAESCADVDPSVPGDCGRVIDDGCCIVLEGCETDVVHARVCSVGCQELSATPGDAIQDCASLTKLLGGASPLGRACQGDFVCSSDGGNLAEGKGNLDSFGALYWCGAGILQGAITGPQGP